MFHRAYRFRIYPTDEQESRLLEWAGAARFAYNLALEQRRDWWRQFKRHRGHGITFATQSKEMTEVRALTPWLQDAPRSILEYALRDLDRAFAARFAGCGFPAFRSKHRSIGFRVLGRGCKATALNRKWASLDIGKGMRLKLRATRAIPTSINTVSINREGVRWFAVLSGPFAAQVEGAPDMGTGIDRGVAIGLALSNGEMHKLPHHVVATNAKRRAAQAALSRRKRGSRRYRKQKIEVAALYRRASSTRSHWLHERSTDIARRFSAVAIEKLSTQRMTRAGARKSGINRAILEQGWAIFANMLKYKLADRGGVLHYVNPAYTSQTCSCCGSVNAESRKSQAVFECVDCGHRANADTNAAINILRRSPAGVEGAGYGPVEARTGQMLTHLENLAA